MKLVEVSPISSKVQKDSLTYFSAKNVDVGDVVVIEVRKSRHDALVIGVSDVRDLKQDIKKATFGFKKILEVKGGSKFYKEFFQSCDDAREFFVGNLGGIANHFLPSIFMENYGDITKPKKHLTNTDFGFSALQQSLDERVKFYKDYLEKMTANCKSVQIILPTVAEVRKFYELLKSDFPNIYVFHSKEKNLLEKYNSLLADKNSVIIISTPSFLFIPRHDLGSIIVEHESSSAYRTIKKPYFDLRIFAKFLARHMKTELIFADELLSIETVARIEDKKTLDFNLTGQNAKTVDMSDKENLYKKSFVLSNEAMRVLQSSGRTFLFALRKGFATQVICHDCRHALKDGDTPLVLYERNGKRVLKNAFTNKELVGLRCPDCGSWNFDSLGIGTDTVREEIMKYFPKRKIFQIDKETTKSESAAKKVVKEFYENDNSILIGTELAIPYLTKRVDHSIIISADSLLHIPSYKIHERMLHLLASVGEISDKTFVIQTRDTKNCVSEAFAKMNAKDFYKKELESRKTYFYPPFATIIKLTHSSNRDESTKIQNFVRENLAGFAPTIRGSRTGKILNTSLVIRLEAAQWDEGTIDKKPKIDKTLLSTLSALGPEWQIRINPENLF